MFTYSNTTEAMWFHVLSKTAEPNAISLLWNFCCTATKFIEMRSKHKKTGTHAFLWGTNCHRIHRSTSGALRLSCHHRAWINPAAKLRRRGTGSLRSRQNCVSSLKEGSVTPEFTVLIKK